MTKNQHKKGCLDSLTPNPMNLLLETNILKFKYLFSFNFPNFVIDQIDCNAYELAIGFFQFPKELAIKKIQIFIFFQFPQFCYKPNRLQTINAKSSIKFC